MNLLLSELRVLVLDCQTTGSGPDSGHLLEVGWSAIRSSHDDPHPIISHLVQPPDGQSIPYHVARLTGIADADLSTAIDRPALWSCLGAAIDAMVADQGGDQQARGQDVGGGALPLQCGGVPNASLLVAAPAPEIIAVSHYARFERRFLAHLQGECSPGQPFPLRFICTHEIALRLFPDLPRRGMRALAGYFGAPLGELKRVAAHVRANAVIWRGLVDLLRRERGVETLEELTLLLERPAPRRGARWLYPMPRERRLALPAKPGVYRFLDAAGKVLYVGKARSLKSRVNSYFRHRRAADKILELVSQARDVHATVTRTCLEAALLEVEEIKRHDPPYNKALRRADRALWFFSRDLEDAATAPDVAHPLGPIPYRETMTGLAALGRATGRMLSGGAERDGHPGLPEVAGAEARGPFPFQDDARLARDLGLELRWLETGALAAGLRLFVGEHLAALSAPRRQPAALLALGARLWEERLADAAADPNADPKAKPNEEDDAGRAGAQRDGDQLMSGVAIDPAEELQLVPEDGARHRRTKLDAAAVQATLEELLLHAVRLIRRAQWIAMLSESAIIWRPAGNRRRPRRCVVMERGQLRSVRSLRSGTVVQPPAGADRCRAERLADLDLATYDRLRVLTTELRRLVGQGREVEVVLGPDQHLRGEQVVRRLRKV